MPSKESFFLYFVQPFVVFKVLISKFFELLLNVLRSNWSCKKVFSFQKWKNALKSLNVVSFDWLGTMTTVILFGLENAMRLIASTVIVLFNKNHLWHGSLEKNVRKLQYSRRGFESHSWHLIYFLLICWKHEAGCHRSIHFLIFCPAVCSLWCVQKFWISCQCFAIKVIMQESF